MKRRLTICCDGTWQASNKAEEAKRSNVAKLAQLISPVAVDEDGTAIPQIIYYQAGVGTSTAGLTEASTWCERLFKARAHSLGGYGLSENVIEAYYFIVGNWLPGTEIYLFGFSRGAYTARALAGIVTELGVFRKESLRYFPEAYKHYRELKGAEWEEWENTMAEEQNWARDENIYIKVLGCWDTVCSLGVPENWFTKWLQWNKPYEFHRVNLSHNVENAFRALALEEHRKPYTPSLWHMPANDDTPARLIQCWFPGMHISAGGGRPRESDGHPRRFFGNNSEDQCSHDYEMAEITFNWMAAVCAPFLTFGAKFGQRLSTLSHDALTDGSWAREWNVRDSYGGFLDMLGGSETRLPGQYLPPENEADKMWKATDTGEYMHSSVRIRFGHKDPPSWPAVLKGFKLRKGKRKDDEVSGWEWVKVFDDGTELVLPEHRSQEGEAKGVTTGEMWRELTEEPR